MPGSSKLRVMDYPENIFCGFSQSFRHVLKINNSSTKRISGSFVAVSKQPQELTDYGYVLAVQASHELGERD